MPSPSTTPVNASSESIRRCVALELPAEVWFLILHRLGYAELRKAARICKAIQKYTQDKSFDAALFRLGVPQPQLARGKAVAWHPMLDAANCTATSMDGACILGDETEYKPLDYPATMKEFATAPASAMVTLDGMSFAKPITVSRAKGVTIKDVLNALVRFWAKKPGRTVAREVHRSLGEYSPGIDKITNRDCLGDHSFWEGIEYAVAEGRNFTKITPRGFGS
ncbi:hypothetical protein JCM10212_000362 [Sporobolomyces blumeae]